MLLLAVLAPPAEASPEPLPAPSTVLPADNASRPASSWPAAKPFEAVDFTLYVSAPFLASAQYVVEVATSPSADTDGTLADAARIDRLVATPRAGFGGVFSVRTSVDARWVGTPGTYWWQAYATRTDPAAGCDPCVYASPVQRLVLTPRRPGDAADTPADFAPSGPGPAAGPSYPGVAPLTRAAARAAVRAAVRRRTGERPRRLRTRCAFPTPYDATCRSTWRDLSFRYRGTAFVWSGEGGTGASFSGTRSVRGCRRAVGRCATPVRWLP